MRKQLEVVQQSLEKCGSEERGSVAIQNKDASFPAEDRRDEEGSHDDNEQGQDMDGADNLSSISTDEVSIK